MTRVGTTYRKYDHIERLGHDLVGGIDIGQVYIFPKLDGTNAVIWSDGDELRTGTRNREINKAGRLESDIQDNAGFNAYAQRNGLMFLDLLGEFGNDVTLYGEWLVPHTMKSYRADAWRKFYLFDVWDEKAGVYLHYEDYCSVAKMYGMDYIEPLCIATNPSEDQIRRQVEANTYLIENGMGLGEGVVIKNYSWKNDHGNQPWAKVVRNEFKEENKREFGISEIHGEFQVEAAIAEKYVTKVGVDKCRAKIRLVVMTEDELDTFKRCGQRVMRDLGKFYLSVEENHRKTFIPRLLSSVYYDLVSEELWSAIKEHKDPTIDFKKLRRHCIANTKKHAMDLF